MEPRPVSCRQTFWSGEKQNDASFARALADGIQIYVSDAFASMHRAHASVVGLPAQVSTCAVGPLVERELAQLGAFWRAPRRGTVAIVGGAKVSDKVGLLRSLCDRTECLLKALRWSNRLGMRYYLTHVQIDVLYWGPNRGIKLFEEMLTACKQTLRQLYVGFMEQKSETV